MSEASSAGSASSPSTSPSLLRSLRRKGRALSRALHPPRVASSKPSAPVEETIRPGNGEEVVQELRAQLTLERSEILPALTARMEEYGESLREGRGPPGSEIQAVVTLWEEYGNGVHAAHISQLMETIPYLRSGTDCQESAALLGGELERAGPRIQEVRSFLLGYSQEPAAYHQLLGLALSDAATVERSWSALEAVIATSCLPSELPESVRAHWQETLPRTRQGGEALLARVRALPRSSPPSPRSPHAASSA